MISLIKKELHEALHILELFAEEERNLELIDNAVSLMVKALGRGNKILTCGNGGSMCDAMHFAEELSGKYRNDRKPMPAVSISDPSLITCIGNDYGFDHIFSRAVEAWGREEDIILIFTSSGNSPNLIHAAEMARRKGMKVIGLTGKSGGELAALCDVEIRAPESQYADRAQEIHGIIVHIFLCSIESALGL